MPTLLNKKTETDISSSKNRLVSACSSFSKKASLKKTQDAFLRVKPSFSMLSAREGVSYVVVVRPCIRIDSVQTKMPTAPKLSRPNP